MAYRAAPAAQVSPMLTVVEVRGLATTEPTRSPSPPGSDLTLVSMWPDAIAARALVSENFTEEVGEAFFISRPSD